MNPHPAICDPERIELFLEQRLTEEEQADFEQHLEDCHGCRRGLEAAAAGDEVWSGVRESLAAEPLSCGVDGSSASTPGGEASYSRAAVLGLLGPTDDDRMLGRLGTYEIVGIVGSGGMGVVLKGFDATLNRYVAIKVLAPHLATSGAARMRFAREARAAAAVIHENVIEIYAVDQGNGLPYLVMPYVRGPSLQRRLYEEGPLSVAEILRVALQTALGLAAAHELGIVHRDVSPANILLAEGIERVKLTDFGLARAADDASLTKTGVIAGTPQYMSPEQARGESVDARSDLFSLGSVLYAMATGRPPFRAETSYGVLRRITDEEPRPIREINPEVPEWLCRIISRLMAKRPEDRFQSAGAVAAHLKECLAHVQQPMMTPLPKVLRGSEASAGEDRRLSLRKLLAGAAIALAVLLAAVVIVLELNKGTLTIESDVNDVSLRITRGDEVVEKLMVTQAGKQVRIAAGTYIVEIDGETDRLTVENETVTLQRGGREVVRIVKAELPIKNAPAVDIPGASGAGQSIEEAAAQFNAMSAEERRTLFNPPIPDLTAERLREGFRQAAALYRRKGKVHISAALQRIAENGRLPEEASGGLIASGVHAQSDTGETVSRQIVPALILPDPSATSGRLLVVLRPLELIYRKDGAVSKDYGDLFEAETRPVDVSQATTPKAPYEWHGTAATKRIEKIEPSFGEMHTGVELGLAISGDARSFRKGDWIPLEVFIRNTGDKKVEFAYSPRLPVARVKNSRGEEITVPGYSDLLPTIYVSLAPGEAYGGSIGFFAPVWNPLMPGKHTVETSLELVVEKERVPLRSGAVEFNIVAEAPERSPHPVSPPSDDIPRSEPGSQSAPMPAVKLEGMVTDSGEGELVEISIGSDDGLRRGDLLDVIRDKTYLGRISVVRLSPDKAVCRIESRQGEIRRGDRVTTQINPPTAAATPAAPAAPTSDAPQRVNRFRTGLVGNDARIAISPDGKLIAIANGNPRRILQTSGASRVEGNWKSSVEILDVESGKSLRVLPVNSDEYEAVIAATEWVTHSEATALAFSPDGRLLAVGTSIGQVKLFDIQTGDVMRTLDDERAKLADNATPEIWNAMPRALGSVRSLAFSPDGSLLAVCGESFADFSDVFDGVENLGRAVTAPGRLKVWDVQTGAIKHDLVGHSQAFAVAFSADGALLASAGRWDDERDSDSGVIVWNAQTGEKNRTLSAKSNGGAHAVALSPSRNLAAIAWLRFDKENDTSSTLIGLAYPVSGMVEWQRSIPGWANPRTFSPDGKTLAVLCGGKSIQFLDAETGATKHEIQSSEGERWSDFALSPNGRSLAIGGVDAEQRGFIEVWGPVVGEDAPAPTAPELGKGAVLRFPEIKELVLSMDSLHFMLDLDTGQTMDPPARYRTEQELMDVHVGQVQPNQTPAGLVGMSLHARKVKPSDWDASQAKVREAVLDMQPTSEMAFDPATPATYFFRTRGGGVGVLQMIEQVDEPKGIRIRYKCWPAD
jgi:serine/threonine protein kinase/WD40 repeat protein